MYNYDINALVSRLANGESQEDIAQEMSDALNQAAKRHKAEEEERLARENASRQRKANAKTCAYEVVTALAKYFNAIGEPELAKSITADNNTIDSTVEMLESVAAILRMFPVNSTTSEYVNVKPVVSDRETKNDNYKEKSAKDWADKAIWNFLASL